MKISCPYCPFEREITKHIPPGRRVRCPACRGVFVPQPPREVLVLPDQEDDGPLPPRVFPKIVPGASRPFHGPIKRFEESSRRVVGMALGITVFGLAAWFLNWFVGTVGDLYTAEEHASEVRTKGVAKWATTESAMQVGQPSVQTSRNQPPESQTEITFSRPAPVQPPSSVPDSSYTRDQTRENRAEITFSRAAAVQPPSPVRNSYAGEETRESRADRTFSRPAPEEPPASGPDSDTLVKSDSDSGLIERSALMAPSEPESTRHRSDEPDIFVPESLVQAPPSTSDSVSASETKTAPASGTKTASPLLLPSSDSLPGLSSASPSRAKGLQLPDSVGRSKTRPSSRRPGVSKKRAKSR